MTDEIKIIHIGHALIRLHAFKVDAALQKQILNAFFFVLGRPPANKVVQRCVCAQYIGLRVVDDAFLPEQLAVCIIN
ncbi:hypothetical protein SDC9_115199 [bioreactor metagenome]|uniref:Uncharacterized protein n=1 Tax=bioreactor metagenome TaxID=1076179 RepID=A0A645BT67_9ZZZZ